MNQQSLDTSNTQQRSAFALALVDLILLCAPILFLTGVLLISGMIEEIWKKPEWSFISILLVMEAFRDIGYVAKKNRIHDEQVAAGYVFLAIFLVITALILVMDFFHSIGSASVDIGIVYTFKYGWFLFCVLTFFYKRYQRHSL